MLYIVATPIGNLEDISLRALETLKAVDLIACEDTRHTRILLDHYNIRKATTSFYQHNRLQKGQYLIDLLKEGKNVALVSDAGSPGILDPGYHLVNLAAANQIPMTFIPGAAAFVNALVLSGKPAHEFFFAGFLPVKKISRQNKLRSLASLGSTFIFYESCHRILKTLSDLEVVFGTRQIVVARELTKKFEEVKRDSAGRILEDFKREPPRGEFVVVV